jgi:hypothetical protein
VRERQRARRRGDNGAGVGSLDSPAVERKVKLVSDFTFRYMFRVLSDQRLE